MNITIQTLLLMAAIVNVYACARCACVAVIAWRHEEYSIMFMELFVGSSIGICGGLVAWTMVDMLLEGTKL